MSHDENREQHTTAHDGPRVRKGSGAFRLQGALPHSLSRLSLTDMLCLGRRRENLPLVCRRFAALSRLPSSLWKSIDVCFKECEQPADPEVAAQWRRELAWLQQHFRRATAELTLTSRGVRFRASLELSIELCAIGIAQRDSTRHSCMVLHCCFSRDTRRSSRSTGAALARAAPQICLR